MCLCTYFLCFCNYVIVRFSCFLKLKRYHGYLSDSPLLLKTPYHLASKDTSIEEATYTHMETDIATWSVTLVFFFVILFLISHLKYKLLVGKIERSTNLDGRSYPNVFYSQPRFRSFNLVCKLHAPKEQLRSRFIYCCVD